MEFKKSIVTLMAETLDEKHREYALLGLMEYTEDCEYQPIHIMIMDLMDQEIKKPGLDASKFIRYIYNRITLENTPIRSKGISTLGQIALSHPTQ